MSCCDGAMLESTSSDFVLRYRHEMFHYDRHDSTYITLFLAPDWKIGADRTKRHRARHLLSVERVERGAQRRQTRIVGMQSLLRQYLASSR